VAALRRLGDVSRSGLDQDNADRFLERWSATALRAYTRLLGDAADSPVIEDRGNENQWFGGFMINYRF
jgi:outer membrane protein